MNTTSNNKTLIVNLLGGPGCAKSTTAAGIFNRLKQEHYNVELVQEFAKKLTWEKNFKVLSDQFFVSATQNHMQNILLGQVQAIITDSPIIIGLMYYNEPNKEIYDSFKNFLLATFKAQNNINFYIKRAKKYNPSGRNQTEDEAKEIDVKMKKFLDENNIPYIEIEGNVDIVNNIIESIKERLVEIQELWNILS